MAGKGTKLIKTKIIGLVEAANKLAAAGPLYTQGVMTLLENFANDRVVTPAKEKYVPVMWGGLRDSIKAQPPILKGKKILVKVSAGDAAVKYALKVHENPRSGKTEGRSPSGKKYRHWARVGQWKYLEIPALDAAKNSAEWLKREATSILYDLKMGIGR